jgi:hypothetical protein
MKISKTKLFSRSNLSNDFKVLYSKIESAFKMILWFMVKFTSNQLLFCDYNLEPRNAKLFKDVEC